MPDNKIFSVDSAERRQVVEKLIEESSPRRSFFMMVILSTALATLGLLIDNIPVVIGAMLVAPLLSPVLCTGMGIVIFDFKLIRRSFIAIIKAIFLLKRFLSNESSMNFIPAPKIRKDSR